MTLPADEVNAIRQLLDHYAHAVDAHDGVKVADLYVPNGKFVYPGAEPIIGAGAIREFADGLSRLGVLRHVVSDPVIEGDSERASCRSYCHVYGISKSGESRLVSRGTYQDTLVKHDGRWHFEERRYLADD